MKLPQILPELTPAFVSGIYRKNFPRTKIFNLHSLRI
jgi:hypothetical protein